ncbi:hypothetical protein THOM_2249 [Trachipleistophora hominis]|uniref:Secreted protein n=1 Tax=Trachipleistophora hominis TaxID=72359 RepID=L7JVP9_TRAHO|nr:hypothetical protein THOM_2249 [Trachipleistophora hominis]
MIMYLNFVFLYFFIVYTNVFASNPHLHQMDTSTYDSDDEEVARILSSVEKKDYSHKPSQSMFYQVEPSKSQSVLVMATSSIPKQTHATLPPTLQSTSHENILYTSQKPDYTTYACVKKPAHHQGAYYIQATR